MNVEHTFFLWFGVRDVPVLVKQWVYEVLFGCLDEGLEGRKRCALTFCGSDSCDGG
jgi:hypothetical protein